MEVENQNRNQSPNPYYREICNKNCTNLAGLRAHERSREHRNNLDRNRPIDDGLPNQEAIYDEQIKGILEDNEIKETSGFNRKSVVEYTKNFNNINHKQYPQDIVNSFKTILSNYYSLISNNTPLKIFISTKVEYEKDENTMSRGYTSTTRLITNETDIDNEIENIMTHLSNRMSEEMLESSG